MHHHSHHLSEFGTTSNGPAATSSSTSSSSIGHLGADPYVGANVMGGGPDQIPMLGGPPSDHELGPMARDRCNTWPMRRPQLDGGGTQQTSPLIHDQIPEEEDLFGSNEHCGRLGGSSNGSNALLHSPGMSSPLNSALSPCDDSPESAAKKATTRRNAWGNMSYADLITQAIIQSPDKRLTLAQVYEWMVQNVPYFRDKGDSNSSAGWKVSFELGYGISL
ncbi:unnamed protein product [Caenorhabditis angaria]|uniref:Fork-head domain-containing protein n=1 Tax=Caenorhabditis angaria TaxID=860376 RepID=A0A9P1MSG7_9PELO|nr:unnamed protein product [Caenorhabditis angaria]